MYVFMCFFCSDEAFGIQNLLQSLTLKVSNRKFYRFNSLIIKSNEKTCSTFFILRKKIKKKKNSEKAKIIY